MPESALNKGKSPWQSSFFIIFSTFFQKCSFIKNEREDIKMKKYFVLFGSVLLMFLLACGKPDEATQAVIDQIGKISEIETITLDNSSLINSALDNYNNLTDSKKKKVNNYNELKTAEEDLNVLQEQLAKEYGEKIKYVLNDMNKTSKICDSFFEKNIEIWVYGISYVEDAYENDATWNGATKKTVTLDFILLFPKVL